MDVYLSDPHTSSFDAGTSPGPYPSPQPPPVSESPLRGLHSRLCPRTCSGERLENGLTLVVALQLGWTCSLGSFGELDVSFG